MNKNYRLNHPNEKEEGTTTINKSLSTQNFNICSSPSSGDFSRRMAVGYLFNPRLSHADDSVKPPLIKIKRRINDPYRTYCTLGYCLLFVAFILFLPSCNRKIGEKHSSHHGLLDKVQEQTFNYFWEGGEPISGGARERIHMDDVYPNHPKDIITSGGTGFGIMATLVGIERGFITREQGYERLLKLTNWLATSDRFHGAWPHWWMPDGKVTPFSKYDNGGDLVETAFLVQGLLTARQYFKKGNAKEKELAQKMDELWRGVDWKWYTRGENVLYWHWSPEYGWKMNFPVHGYNECLIMYVLAASSPTHGVDAAVYEEGFMMDGKVVSNDEHYGLPEVLYHYGNADRMVGPLFWAHYSYLGLNPEGLKDQYSDFWKLNQNHALIQYRYCVDNPNECEGYSDSCWGLTSSYSIKGYAGHNPDNDLCVISPTAALSSFPYTPEESNRFLHFLYDDHPELIGEYGPYDAFSLENDWFTPRYLAIDQLPIPVMIENYRTGLLWDLFMSAPEIQQGLDKLGFEYLKAKSY